ncbi:MAG TPA: hypothetical protein PKE66_00995 [Pyrinomonadaceae bacterium]|nr:hypothetical protein [Pyrinomonadaceae bacterium]
MKSFRHIFLLLMLIWVSVPVEARSADKNCFTVKHLDLFGLDLKSVKWPESEIDALLAGSDSTNARFLIPMIVRQLAAIHSCHGPTEHDLERALKLIELYVALRGEPINFVNKLADIDGKIEAISNDFNDQVLNDKILPHLIYSMDDGPLSGNIVSAAPNSKPERIAITSFGEVRFISHGGRLYAVATDRADKVLWARVLKGANPDRFLSQIGPEPMAVNTYEAAIVVSLFVDSERMTMYLRPSGSFVFYLHSW